MYENVGRDCKHNFVPYFFNHFEGVGSEIDFMPTENPYSASTVCVNCGRFSAITFLLQSGR